MVKKLLLKVFTFWALILTSFTGWGQCPASVSITATPGQNICAGESVEFTAIPSSGSSHTYQWQINGVNVSGATATTFTRSNLNHNDQVRVVVKNSADPSCIINSSFLPITVNPIPTVTTANTATICSGTGPNISLTASTPSSFSWTIGTITGGITGASAGSGSTINQVLTNPSNSAAGTVQYIVTPTATAGSCEGNPYTITVTVNPKPVVTTVSSTTICSGTSPNISLTSSTPSSFSWTIGAVTGGITGASAGSGSTINQTLTNPSNSTAGTLQYIVTPTATTGSCAGEPYTITVTVNPKPSVTTTNTAIVCSGASPNIALTASTPSTFSWTLGSNTGNISGASAGSGSTINQILTNPSISTAGTVEYIVTPTATTESCKGEPYTITVTVNPKPSVTTTNTATVCSGASPNIALTASTSSTFSWTVGSITGNIAGASNGTGSTINQALTNPSSSTAGTVEYIVTPTATTGSCTGEPYTITVTVNPKPSVTTTNTATVCSGSSPNIALTASTPSTFSWTVSSITGNITGASNGTGSTINQVLTNPSNSAAGTVQYIVTPTANAGSCVGEPYTITVTVNPRPTVTTANTATVCSGFGPNISLTASTPSSFSWTVGSVTGNITGATNGTGSTINQTLTNPSSSTAGTVQYNVTPTATTGSCAGEPYIITVTVNPTLVPSVSITSTSTEICTTAPTGSAPVTFTASPVYPGTNPTYQWKRGTTNVGTNSATYTANSLPDGSQISVVMTSNAVCAAPVTATSNVITMKGYTPPAAPVFNPAPSKGGPVNTTLLCPPNTGLVYTVAPDSNVLSYKWTLPTGWTITAGEGTNSITINNSNLNAGTYNLVATAQNACGSSSTTLSVTIDKAASVFAGADASICKGGSYTISDADYSGYINAGGNNAPTWTVSPAGSGTFSNTKEKRPTFTPGASFTGTLTLTLTSTKTTGTFNCEDLSDQMILTVNAPPAITAQPSTANQTVCLNTAATPLSVTATGAGLTYQWYSNTTNSTSGGTAINGATSSSYSPSTTTAGTLYYYVIVSGTCTPPVTSNVSGAITVNEAPTITAQPSTTPQTVCLSAAATQLSVTATGAGLTYQWYSNVTNSSTGGTLITNATSSTYTPVTTTAGTLYYYVIVSGTCTPAVTSNVSGAVNVNAPPTITAQPSTTSQTFCPNAAATQLSVTATGAGLTYQWYSNTANTTSGGTAINGATDSTFTPETTTSGTLYYYVVVSGTCTPAVTSNITGAVTVSAPPEISSQPSTANQTLCTNDAATELSVTANGDGLTYQWYSNTTNSNTGGTLINNATASTFTPVTTIAGNFYYYVVVSGTCTPAVASNASGLITVNEAPAITAQPSANSQIVCLNDTATELSVTATGAGLSYQWYSNTANTTSGGTAINGATASTFTPAATTPGILYYYVVVSGTCTPEVTSNVSGAVTVNALPEISSQPSTAIQTLCLNDSATELSVTATGEGLTYQWYSNTTNSNTGGTSINNATAPTYTPLTTTVGTLYYYVVVSGTCTPPVTSNVSGAVTVNEPVIITKDLDNSSNYAVCVGFPIDFKIEATGTGLTYEWTRDGQPVGTNSPTLEITQASVSDAGKYKVLVKGTAPCADVLSREITLVVNQNLTITTQPEPAIPVCLGENSILIGVVVSGNVYDYVWRKNGIPISDGNGTKYSGTATANLTIKNLVLADSDTYDVVISSPEGSCSQIISTPSVVTVYEPPTADAGPDLEVCSTQTTIALSGATSSNHTSLIWTTTGGGQINNASDISTATYSPIAADSGKEITFTLTSELKVGEKQICADAVDTRKITIIPQPVISEFSYVTGNNTAVSGEFCETDNNVYTPHTAGENLANGTGVYSVNNTALSVNQTTGAITPNGTTPGDYIITYRYTVNSQESNCTVAEKSFTVTITNKPVADFTYENTPFCSNAGNPLPLMGANSVKGIFSSSSTQLKFIDAATGEVNIAGSTPGTYTVNNTIAASNGCAEVIATSTITINQRPAAPVVTDVAYCLNEESVPALTANADSGATLNWYTTEEGGTASSTAPQPNTSTAGTSTYWVSQTSAAGCESERAPVTATIYALPVVTAQVTENTICLGSMAQLSATGGVTYSWYLGENVIGNQASVSHTPTAVGDYKYKVIVTDGNGCKNSAEVNVKVDAVSVAGVLTAPASVCINNPSGTLNLSGFTGNIVKWETKPASGSTWTTVSGNTSSTLNFSGLTVPTDYKVTVKNGVCAEVSLEARINIDPLPVGGKLAFADIVTADNDGRIFTICQGATTGYLPITLTGHTGSIVAWKYSVNGSPWTTIAGETGNILSADKIKSLNLAETTVFRVEVGSGACVPNAFSQTAILSVIPTDIEPKPVTVSKDVICMGDAVTLSSETGYSALTPTIPDGTFDNAGIKNNGWRFRNNGTSANFETNANNTNDDYWSRATPHDFNTAQITSPFTVTAQRWAPGNEEGNKGFAIVSGPQTNATMETNTFSIGSMDQAVLTFDQAFNLTPGATIKVEISKDGGNKYEKVLFTRSGSASSGNYANFGTVNNATNRMILDLGDYLGFNNLRIRFSYTGTRTGDIWAVDAIKVPSGPKNVAIEWNDYTNPEDPIYIGNTNSVQYTPTKIGLNIFEVKTRLIFDTAGNACDVAENAENIAVFAFDKYTTSATKVVEGCGSYHAQLGATVTGAAGGDLSADFKTAGYNTPDGYKGEWLIEGPAGYALSNPNSTDTRDPKNNPDAILTATGAGDYKVTWKLIPVPVDGKSYTNSGCQPTTPSTTVSFKDCIALDFDGINDYVDLGEGYTGDYSIEAWIKPEASTGTIVSTPNLEINMADLPPVVVPNTRWFHIAVDAGGNLYVDGIDVGKQILNTGDATRSFIGAKWTAPSATNFFSGWIEEVRIWDGNISQDQIKFLMNQRLQNTSNIGVEIPMPAPGLAYSALAGYYQLLTTTILNGGYTPDLATGATNAKLRNMETFQENTAPLPYTSKADGEWSNRNTWTQPVVWDFPNSTGHGGQAIEWNIVRTSHNITSGSRDITLLGLISEANILDMQGVNPASWTTGGSGNELYISHYLLLNGIIDLNGESQLVQPNGSLVEQSAGINRAVTGYLDRDQQGTASSYNYNYWSSPVSPGAANSPYSIGAVMMDGTTLTPQPLSFGTAYHFADGVATTPRKVSNYWLHKFHGTANNYFKWKHIGSTGTLNVGEGYSMKGTSGKAAILESQNYTFRGLPNNGDIKMVNLNASGEGENYLIGNPYPSALNIDEFILDNMRDVKNGRNTTGNIFNGTIYFWSHFSNQTHYLQEYIGGYAAYNLSGGVKAVAIDERINATEEEGGREPRQFVPVGQGFFVSTQLDSKISSMTGTTIHGGQPTFKNSQRIFVDEVDATKSVFHSAEKKEIIPGANNSNSKAEQQRIWLKFQSPKGYHRQILVTADPNASDNFDLGYDAPLIENNIEDMYWYFNDHEFVIQGVEDFNNTRELQLGIKVKEKGTLKISIDKLGNIAGDKNIYLKDSLLEVLHDLRKEPYIAESEEGIFVDRFKLVFSDGSAVIGPEDPVIVDDGPFEIMYINGTRVILIKNPELIKVDRIYLNNLLGQQVHVYYNVPLESRVELPVERFSSGVYILKLHTENGIMTKKVILD